MTFREKLMSLFEGDRAAHYKGATEPEGMHDKSKSSKGAMDMLNTPKSTEADGMKAAKDTAMNIAKSVKKGKRDQPIKILAILQLSQVRHLLKTLQQKCKQLSK